MKKRVAQSALLLAVVGLVAGLTASHRGHPAAVVPAKALESDLYNALSAPVPRAASFQPVPRPDRVRAIRTIVSKGAATIGPPPSPTSTTWQGDDVAALTVSNQTTTTGGTDAHCNTASAPAGPGPRCDDFLVTVNTPQPNGALTVDVTVPAPEDYDLYIFDKDGKQVGSSGNSNGQNESATVPCPSLGKSPYKVRIVYFTTAADQQTYGATASWAPRTCLPESVPTYNNTALTFQSSSLVSAHFLGSEPQVTVEHPETWSDPGQIDPNRIFVDWPLTSRSNIGQLSRSLDGGDSFRLLFDPTCATRNRPNCGTGGGGDTENDVNLKTGNVFFADQEVLANEASATSLDHGDTWINQTPVSNTTTATDRQWLAATDNTAVTAGNLTIESFFTYHVPPNAYIQAIPTSTHIPLPQPVPQLNDAGQTGQPKVDNNPNSPGHGWIYYPFRGFLNAGGYVATAAGASYFDPLSWKSNLVAGTAATSFPWIAIDRHGNAYMTWDAGGIVYYAFSPIDNPLNNPLLTPAGRPGTVWSGAVQVSPPGLVTSAIFPEGTALDTGKLGVAYMGTNEHTGDPNVAPTSTHWNVYAASITNAASAAPVINTGIVSHRIVHHGSICTHGTTCGTTNPAEDRSLADMIDVGVDANGRLGVVFQDNNTAAFQDNITGADLSPFDYFAKETVGPTLSDTNLSVSIPQRLNSAADPTGDATWPNKAYTTPGQNLPALDITNLSLGIEGGNLVAHLKLNDATIAGMQRDFAAYNAAPCTAPCAAQRLQFVVRFNTGSDAFHMDAELSSGTAASLRFFGGILDKSNDGLVNPGSPTGIVGSGYHTDFPITGALGSGEITLSAPLAAYGLAPGSKLFSVTGLAMAGPSETAEVSVAYVMRTVDASPPFDTTLGAPTNVGLLYLTAARNAKPKQNKVLVKWKTAAEPDTLGFRLYRVVGKKSTRIGGLFPSKGAFGGVYSYTDTLPKLLLSATGSQAAAKPCYRLDAVGTSGAPATTLKTVCLKK